MGQRVEGKERGGDGPTTKQGIRTTTAVKRHGRLRGFRVIYLNRKYKKQVQGDTSGSGEHLEQPDGWDAFVGWGGFRGTEQSDEDRVMERGIT